MSPGVLRFCAWSGPLFMLLFFIAMIVAVPLIPPMPPSASSAEVMQFYKDHSIGIRVASAFMMYGCAFGWVWTACNAVWTAKMEGSMPVLSIAQVPCGVFSFGGTYFTCIAWASAAFRPDRPEALVYLMNDQGWFWIVMMGSCAVIQMIFIGLAVLNDRSAEPIYPRWVGYFNVWVGVLQIPGVMMAFFHDGPFAWNGLFAFWLPLNAFTAWVIVNTWAMLRATRREQLRVTSLKG